jgi:regulatory protein
MNIISIKTETSGESRRIELSDGSVFSFMPCYLPPDFDESLCTPEICGERSINIDEEEALRFASACTRAEMAALKLIARAEQSPAGLSYKLEKRGHDRACVQRVIFRLQELTLLDERRFIRLWLESRIARRADSPRRLLANLCARGIDRDYAESGVKAALDTATELELLRRYVKKLERRKSYLKITGRNNADAERSLKYHLKSEGFSSLATEMLADDE